MRWFAIVLALSLAVVASAQVPRVLSYQGILTDRDGRILPDGEYRLTIRLYDSEAATEPLYVEEQRVVAVRGVVNVLIGTVEPLPWRLTFDRVYYVGISVDGSEELRPRTMLTAVPYALRSESAAVADVAKGLTPDALKGVTVQTTPSGPAGGDLSGTYPNPMIGTSKVTTAKIATAAVTTDKIAPRAVTGNKINQMGATNGQVLTWVTGTTNDWMPTSPSAWAWVLSGNSTSGSEFLGTTNAQPLVVKTNNVERLRITSGGNVGIGTTSPTNLLHIVGSSNPVRVQGLSTDNTIDNILVVDANGVMKIRTATSLSGSLGWSLTGNGSTNPSTNFLGTTDAADLVVRTNNTERVRITSGGSVGIGTTSPTATLDVAGNANISGSTTIGTGLTVSSGGAAITGNSTVSGNISVSGNATVSGTQVSLPNIPGSSTATDVVVRTSGGNLEYRSASSLVSVVETDPQVGTLSNGQVAFWDGTASALTGSGNLTWTGTVLGVTGDVTATGNLTVDGNTTLGNAAGDQVTVNAGAVQLLNIPGSSTATDVVVRTSGGNLEYRSASSLVSVVETDPQVGTLSNGQVAFWDGTASALTGSGNLTWTGTVLGVTGDVTATGNLTVDGNTTLGNAAGDQVTVNAGAVQLLNIPGSSTATDVVVRTSSGNLEYRSASSLVSVVETDPQVGTLSNGQVAFWDGTASALTGSGNLTWTGTVLGVTGDVTATGNLTVDGNTTLGNAAGDQVTVNAGAVQLLNIPGSSTATDVVVRTSGGNLEYRSASSLVSVVETDPQVGTLSNGQVAFWDGTASALTGSGNLTWTGTALGVTGDVTATGNLTVDGNTTLGNAAGDQVTVNAGAVQLLNIPGSSTATDVVVRTSGGNLEYRSASSLIGGTFWSLTGNSGTDPATNFLGTTDGQPLVIRVDNQETFRFNAPGGSAPAWSIHRGGGNQRGLHAVDLQSARAAATEVASGDYSVISGGLANTASGNYSTVGGGWANTASNWYSTVGGGADNTASGPVSTVGGGLQNTASGQYSTVGGGADNTASGLYSTVGGGYQNTASNWYSTVGGGVQNTASGQYSTVGGGVRNIAAGDYSAIPGGYNLKVGDRSFGFSGQTSTTPTDLSSASNIAAFVDVDLWLYNVRNQASQLRLYEPSGAGTNFTAFRAQAQAADITYTLPASLTPVTTVAAGLLQTDASGNLSWVSPSSLGANAWSLTGNSGTDPATNFLGTTDGQPLVIRVDNQETFRFNAPGGSAPAWSIHRGGGNQRGLHAVDLQSARAAATEVASGDYSVISGGLANTASNWYSTVGGGRENTASGTYSTVGGGGVNTASGGASTVGGGLQNTASGQYSTVGGGADNTASGTYSTVGGGLQNTASGGASTVGGGLQNTASDDYSTVGGGSSNTASGDFSAIPGGYNLRVGDRSFGFSGQTSTTQTDLSSASNIAAFVDVDLWLYNVRNQASQLRLYEPSGSGTNYTAFRAQAQAGDITYTLPASLTPVTTVGVGLLQTDASGNLSWVDPSSLAVANAWSLTGNSGTNPATNFLGTTDAQPVVIRVDNQETFRFNAPGSSAPGWSIQRGGGNQRGLHAVDLQSARTAATQVASGDYSVIGGGYSNTAINWYSTVGGGWQNTASGYISTVGGGWQNTASGDLSTVGGGWQNTASGDYSTVGGGVVNTASNWYSTVGGGWQNTASGGTSTVGGGSSNTASGGASTVGGGYSNTASDDYSTVGGGAVNTASGSASTVGGGSSNTASGDLSTVGGGYSNTAINWYSTVGGGWQNTASGYISTVGGGWQNTASGQYSTVGGGQQNTASGNNSTVGGGYQNTASGQYSTVGGGYQNTASGQYSTVGGGHLDTAIGTYSAIPGGYSNTANANFNLVYGENVDPSVTETHRVYFFGDGSTSRPSGFLVINRLNGDYPIHVGTNGGNGNGAYLSGGGTWTNGSSRSFKERFVQYNPQEVLEKILALPVEGYYYKGTEEYHITPMAEDFYRLFRTGVHEIIETDSAGQLVRRPNPDVDKYLSAADVAGVALLGIQALAERVDAVPGDIGALRQENERLTAEVAQLRQENQDQQQQIAQLKEQNVQLSRQNAELQRRLERLESLVEHLAGGSRSEGVMEGWLGDNIPNPHEGTTVIPYFVPTGVGSAELVIEDGAGRRVLGFVLSERGVSGQVVVRMEQLSSGRYEYRLVLDGRVVASKAMQLVR